MTASDKSLPLQTVLCRWLAKETRGFIGGLTGGLIGGLFSFSAINYVGRIATVNATDAVSIANTYIVYTTFVIAAVALLLTVAGLIFTQHFAVEKEAHIAHAFSSVLEVVRSDDEKAVKFVQQAMEIHVSLNMSAKRLRPRFSRRSPLVRQVPAPGRATRIRRPTRWGQCSVICPPARTEERIQNEQCKYHSADPECRDIVIVPERHVRLRSQSR